MTATISSKKPISCDLAVFSKAERAAHSELSRRLFAACTGMREMPEGLALFFDTRVLESDLKTWCANEARCCAFAAYEISKDTNGLCLTVRASDEGRVFLRRQYKQILGSSGAPGTPGLSPRLSTIGALLAGMLCLACLVPIVGGFLVARGIVSSFWNPGELVWIGLGLAVSAGWFAFSKWKKRHNVAAGCGC